MSIENKLDYWVDRIKIQWLGMGLWKYLSFLVVYALIPFNVWIYSRIDSEYYIQYLEEQAIFFVPLIAIWWELLLLQQYIEGEGRELLWVERSSKLADCIIYLGMYFVCLLPLLVFLVNHIEKDDYIIPVLLSQSFLYVGCFYMVSLFTLSISSGFIIVFIYSLFSENRIASLLTAVGFDGFRSPLIYCIVGFLFFLVGESYYKYYEKKL